MKKKRECKRSGSEKGAGAKKKREQKRSGSEKVVGVKKERKQKRSVKVLMGKYPDGQNSRDGQKS